jgi:hypothetical protein
MKKRVRSGGDFKYDVCLSFAGEDRTYVESVADFLASKGVRVFYDKYERVELWGKDLYSHLADVYGQAAGYCVLFVSTHYASKLWTIHERRSAQARAFSENREYILPARFDNTEIPGLLATVGYVDLRNLTPRKFAALITEKLGPRPKTNFLPPELDRLYKRVGVTSDADKERVSRIASSFFESYRRMSADERKVISMMLLRGCPTELPKNIHINLDLLRRETGFPINKIERILGGLRSLGFNSAVRDESNEEDPQLGERVLAIVSFDSLTVGVESGDDDTEIAVEMSQGAVEDFCETCGPKALMNADFSQLARATTTKEIHSQALPRRSTRRARAGQSE